MVRTIFERMLAKKIVPGNTLLIIPSRHPIQFWMMLSFVAGCFFQTFSGPEAGIGTLMSHSMFIMSALMMGAGGLAALVSAATAVRRPWDSLGLSLCAMIMLTTVMAFHAWTYITAMPAFWTSFGFWFTVALGIGFAHRGFQVLRDTLRVWRLR